MDAAADSAKRKRSPSFSASALPPAKALKPTTNQLSINYLARQSPEDLPLLTKDDSLPNLLLLLSQYSSVLDRHESLASNLGARPLGPILIKRFERCFDAPPKVVTSHHKPSTGQQEDSSQHMTWLEVIEFARSHPSQFTLATYSEGSRVCQFYYPQKQMRVQISEEDFLFINSGRCQELIPPLPIWEDEEKEVGACDVLEAKLKELTNAADIVAARTRQLSHRLKGRRAAILERRAEGGSGTPAKASAPQMTTAPPPSTSGFNAVNAPNGRPMGENDSSESFAAVRSELLRHFESLPHNQNVGNAQSRHQSVATVQDSFHPGKLIENVHQEHQTNPVVVTSTNSSLSPGPIQTAPNDAHGHCTSDTTQHGHQSISNNTSLPGRRLSSSAGTTSQASQAFSKHNFSKPLPAALESSQPFRPLCQAHMDTLPRGHRVIPPCDRCRRLRMDCVKNLTSCAGCTKKHARCHWREVSRDELGALDSLMEGAYSYSGAIDHALMNGYANRGIDTDERPEFEDDEDDDSNPLEDLEALGEKEEAEHETEDDRRRVETGRTASELQSSIHTETRLNRRLHDAPNEQCYPSAGTTVRNEKAPATSDHGDLPPKNSTEHHPGNAKSNDTHDHKSELSSTHGQGHLPRFPVHFPSATSHGGFRAVNN
ncbi:Hypothetical protein R9X50_00638100 [Acrodontium crateriforme]|uniref:Zn(2)-C6 fungal-type domain-containing protein n=1 Tax=Acrodontium crateriforme TaxID=150365 RepID=A0AAQ3R6S0_9PEZI|nr:Hypothetical protein R9X50_00638100 [Acrodontium crateriforme]